MNDWENPGLTGRNRLEAHAWLEAWPEERGRKKLLNGQWDFALFASPLDLPAPGESVSWSPIRVPGVWQLQGWGHPHYTNVVYPFPVDPPRVPSENPTGLYRRTVEVPEAWAGRPLRLRFEGVDSAFWVLVDGVEVGFSKGSRLVHEFDLGPFVKGPGFELTVRVVQWNDGTYLEDQDQWWLSGIFRDVWLLSPDPVEVYDAFARAGYDPATGAGTLRVDTRVQGPGAALSARLLDPEGRELWARASLPLTGFEASLPLVHPWTAETPVLYRLVLEVFDASGTLATAVSLRVGFRTLTRGPHAFFVNGRRIILKGVNRHDNHPRLGRVTPVEDLRRDLLLMKAHNVNAVRTSHYPNDRHFFDLCDELGLYLVAECDLETHGFTYDEGKNPSEWPQWQGAYVDRMTRLVEAFKNHPAILFWSLGNESSFGVNHEAMAAWTRARDPERLVHYEGATARMLDRLARGQDGRREGDCVDVVSRMYPSPDQWRAEADADATGKPFVLCEYAHAMGNGPGVLTEYWNLFWHHPRMQGGFVWEWADHGLEQRSADGRPWDAYGGDFGESPHDGNFVCDGLVFSDRTPTPGLIELKAHQAPVWFGPVDLGRGRVEVWNRHDFSTLAGYTVDWTVLVDGRSVAGDRVAAPDLEAGGRTEWTVAGLEAALGRPGTGEKTLRLSVRTRADLPWAPAGHEVAFAEWGLEASSAPKAPPTRAGRPEARGRLSADRSGLVLETGDARLTFDRARGLLSAWTLSGVPILTRGPRLQLWRAKIDNDWMFGLPEGFTKTWQAAGYDALQHRVDGVEGDGQGVVIRTRVAPPSRLLGWAVEYAYRVVAEGAVELTVTVKPEGEGPHLPRLGVDLTLPGAFHRAWWYGLGPGESYVDSRAGLKTGVWEAGLEALHTDYAFPQENGNRHDTRWMGLYDDRGTGLFVTGGDRFGFSAHPYAVADLDAARHRHEVPRRDEVTLVLDHRQCGLGSGSCGPLTFEAYRVPNQEWKFRFVLAAHSRQESSSEALWRRLKGL